MHPNPACIRQDMSGRDRPILLKKSIHPNCSEIDGESASFARGYVKSEPRSLGEARISISDAYFSAVETKADFFNRIYR